MEPPGVLPPDRDKYLLHSNVNTSTTTITSANQLSTSTSIGGVSTSTSQQTIERLSRPMAFDKMESLVKEMQDAETGVPVRSQKLFLTSIPSAFMGYDLIEWLMERLSIEESEALNIANQLCLHGYFFPVNDSKTLVVKDDSSLYRFQTPYYWPWQHKAPDNVEYAIYLAKRSLRNKQRHGLEEYETEALANLHKNLKGKWDFITMQAEEQVKLAKERKKGDKIVGDSQERAYWRVHRPPTGQFTPLEPCPVPSRDRQGKPRRRTIDDWQREVDILTVSLGRTRMKMSQACECLVTYCETFADYDPMIQPPLPSNPWVSEDITFWQLNSSIVDIPTEKRVKRWAISIEEIVSDSTGLQEFTNYLKKEYSHENIRFWLAVNDLRRSSHSLIPKKVNEIYAEFLAPGAPCEINIDGKTMENVQLGLKSPTRFAYDAAAEHIYALLLKKDCYPRFVRSEHYKSLVACGIQPSHKKRFFGFGGVAKKKSTTVAPNPALLAQASGTSSSGAANLARRRGSDRSLSGSAHELAVSGVKDNTKVPHSHSQSNLSDIPYREQSKSFSENLETTIEGCITGGGATACCPWDTNEPTIIKTAPNVSVSVCPWEEADNIVTSSTSAKSIIIPNVPITTAASLCEKPKSSKVEPTNVISDITEVSERMKRSCGLRQNTLDSDFHSTKRLMPTKVEQRRSSVTIAPRVSDLHFTPRRPSNIILPSTSGYQPDSGAYLTSVGLPRQIGSQQQQSLARAVSFEDKSLLRQQQTIVISEEDEDEFSLRSKNKVNVNFIDNTNEKTIIVDDIDEVSGNNSVLKTINKTVDESADHNKVLSNSNNNSANNLILKTHVDSAITVVGDVSEYGNEKPVATATTPIITRLNPPTINVVSCPTIEVDSKELDDVIEEDDIDDENATTDVEETLFKHDEKKHHRSQVEEIHVIITEAPFVFIPLDDPQDITSLKTLTDDDLAMHEDLSPTTDEYQECMTFQHQDPGETEDFDLVTDGGNFAPGCVAPAPTPCPSIAPLAEVEIDPPDDEGGDTDPAVKKDDEERKKRRKKRSSEDKADSLDKPSTSSSGDVGCSGDVDGNKKNIEENRFAVCPWEDEDVATTVDQQPFVKTYSTLGYL